MVKLSATQESNIKAVGRLLFMAGVPKSILAAAVAQVCFETGYFANAGWLKYNNYSGIKYTSSGNQKNSRPAPVAVTDGSGGNYAIFNTPLDWAVDYVRILSMGSPAPIGATTPDDFVTRLSANGYFTSDLATYEASVDSICTNHVAPLLMQILVGTAVVVGTVATSISILGYFAYAGL